MYYVPCNTKVLLVLKCLFKFQINISLVYDIGWQLMEGLLSLKFTSRFIISSFMGQKSERYISLLVFIITCFYYPESLIKSELSFVKSTLPPEH